MNLDSPSAEGYPTWLCWHQRLKAGRRDTKVHILVFELYRRPEMYLQFSTTHTYIGYRLTVLWECQLRERSREVLIADSIVRAANSAATCSAEEVKAWVSSASMQEPRKGRLQHRQLGTGHTHENDGKHPPCATKCLFLELSLTIHIWNYIGLLLEY